MEEPILWAILTACAFVLIAILDEWAWVWRNRRAERRAKEWEGREGAEGV